MLLDRARLAVTGTALHADKQPVKVTFSAGITEARPGDTIDLLLSRADEALYRAKDAGRDRVEVSAPAS